MMRPMYHRCRALLAAGRGLAEPAGSWAAEAIARAEDVGCRWDWLEARRAQGMVALLERDPARAIECLRPAWQHIVDERLGDPGTFPVAPELVEALAEAGELDEARAIGDALHAQAQEREHPWGLITARRCRAVVRLSSGAFDAEAAQALEDVAGEYGRLGLGYERARTLLSLGRAARRLKQWGAARDALECAAGYFDELGSTGWAELTRAELARVGGRRPRASGELTPTEREAVELAAGGMANKEIAAAMYLGVHTVEVHLSRAYAKLGVRSRGQLAARLSIENP
jgi:DNA-binding CsgD family transcriptional regulator